MRRGLQWCPEAEGSITASPGRLGGLRRGKKLTNNGKERGCGLENKPSHQAAQQHKRRAEAVKRLNLIPLPRHDVFLSLGMGGDTFGSAHRVTSPLRHRTG